RDHPAQVGGRPGAHDEDLHPPLGRAGGKGGGMEISTEELTTQIFLSSFLRACASHFNVNL
ncbi:MAG: hypothetical protein PHV09_01395, partial [Bacteroidales bacterium]|nr:hypothetical protein [Bacteroidales bacterium]